jgi:hypothetical protein
MLLKKIFKFSKFNFCEKVKVDNDGFTKFMNGQLYNTEFGFKNNFLNFEFDFKAIIKTVLSSEAESDLDTQIIEKFKKLDLDKIDQDRIKDILNIIMTDKMNELADFKSNTKDPKKDKLFNKLLTMINETDLTLPEKQIQDNFHNLSKII